ncbi:MAG: hypothetical protein ACJAV7_001597 [Flavobacteriales bacterium]
MSGLQKSHSSRGPSKKKMNKTTTLDAYLDQ